MSSKEQERVGSGKDVALNKGRFRLDMRNKLFPMRVVWPWNRLPKEAVDAPSLEVFQARLDGVLSNLVCWEVSLSMAAGLELGDPEGSLPTHSVTLCKSFIVFCCCCWWFFLFVCFSVCVCLC